MTSRELTSLLNFQYIDDITDNAAATTKRELRSTKKRKRFSTASDRKCRIKNSVVAIEKLPDSVQVVTPKKVRRQDSSNLWKSDVYLDVSDFLQDANFPSMSDMVRKTENPTILDMQQKPRLETWRIN